jgi:hypothetical protein
MAKIHDDKEKTRTLAIMAAILYSAPDLDIGTDTCAIRALELFEACEELVPRNIDPNDLASAEGNQKR